MTSRQITLVAKNPSGKIPEGLEEQFRADVQKKVRCYPHAWETTTAVFGHLCEDVEYTGCGLDDHISIPISNQDGEDGGYIHLCGWKESED